MLSIVSELLDYLNNKFQGDIPNIIFFAIGIAIGIFLFFIISLIILLIYKIRSKRKTKIVTPLEVSVEYKAVINANKDIYINVYKDASIGEKISGIGKILLNMMESISSLYFPDSNDPIFEISVDQLVDFIGYFTNRINEIIDNLLQNKFKLVNVITKNTIKDKKISLVMELIDKSKEEKKEKNTLLSKVKDSVLNVGKKIAFKWTESVINSEFLAIIDTLGEDINKLYSKQDLLVESQGDQNA